MEGASHAFMSAYEHTRLNIGTNIQQQQLIVQSQAEEFIISNRINYQQPIKIMRKKENTVKV
jgi:hypothetical protein